MRTKFLIFLFLMSLSTAQSQSISGQLTTLPNRVISLYGFNGIKTYLIDQDTLDGQGNFALQYADKDRGMGYLTDAENKIFYVILSGEKTKISGKNLAELNSIRIVEGKENKWLEQYATERSRREQALSALTYLDQLYQTDTLFNRQFDLRNRIAVEFTRIIAQDSLFLANLPSDSYAASYLPLRKFISSVSNSAQYSPNDIPKHIEYFRKLDFTSNDLYKSGLLKDLIDSHFWLLENRSLPKEVLQSEMQLSVDAMLKNLSRDEKKLNAVSKYLLESFESRNYVNISEYMALKLLNQTGCTIDGDFARQLESYQAMKTGRIAPDFSFAATTLAPGFTNRPVKLTDIKSRYILLVFGASWCPQCAKEIPLISNMYPALKQKDVEVVFVSLDTDKASFDSFTKNFPFVSTCDFKKWDGQAVTGYYVFATPSFFLLDKDRRILAKPFNLEQFDSWVNSNINN